MSSQRAIEPKFAYAMAAAFVVLGILGIVAGALGNRTFFALGVVWVLLAAGWVYLAKRPRRR